MLVSPALLNLRYFYVVDGAVRTTDEWEQEGPPIEDKKLAKIIVEKTLKRQSLTTSVLQGANAVPIDAAVVAKRKAEQAKLDLEEPDAQNDAPAQKNKRHT